MTSGRIRRTVAGLCTAGALCCAASAAHADLKICNRMSYVVDAAIAIEERGAAASRGWFRINPGDCRPILQGTPTLTQILFVHARVPALYGAAPLPQGTGGDFCVAEGNFVIGGARNCRAGQKLAPFAAVKASVNGDEWTVNLAEDAEYSNEQARDAGIQRLLVAAGYDATPIDGIRGSKTDAALSQFIQDNRLPVTVAARSDIFEILLEAAQKPGAGFSWCNDTTNPVMAAIGVEERSVVVTRGWYRIEPGKCLRPDIAGQPQRIFSFAEAVDGEGRVIRQGDRPLAWGGEHVMCTRVSKFEIVDQNDCAAKGLTASGFAAIDLAGREPTTVRFK